MNHMPNPSEKEIIEWWFGSDSRVAGLLGGERSGKSWTTTYMAGGCIDPFKEGLYWIVGPDYYQPRAEFQYLYDAWVKLGVVADVTMPKSHTAPWTMTSVAGCVVTTRSSNDVMKLSSFTVDGWILAEAGQQAFETYTRGLARVSETRGFLILSGTLEKSRPWYEDLYRRWQAPNTLQARFFSLPTWSNVAVYPGGRDDPAIKELESEYPEDLFMERFGAVPQKLHGVVIPEFDYAKHVKHLEVDPDVPVELWMDPGKHVYCVCFVQVIGMFTHVLDVIYERGKIIDDIAVLVQGNRLFQYVEKSRAGVIDIAGKQEHSDRSQVKRWLELAGINLRYRYVFVRTGYEKVRQRLRSTNIHHRPLLYFNDHISHAMSATGKDALGPLAEFSLWRFPEMSEKQNEPPNPIDRNNHMLKALGYGLVDHFGSADDKKHSVKTRKEAYWRDIA